MIEEIIKDVNFINLDLDFSNFKSQKFYEIFEGQKYSVECDIIAYITCKELEMEDDTNFLNEDYEVELSVKILSIYDAEEDKNIFLSEKEELENLLIKKIITNL